MSAYVMIRVARKCPSNRDELEGCGNPLPRLVQQHAEDILEIVGNAKDETAGSADATTPLNPRTPMGAGTRPPGSSAMGVGGGGSSGSSGRRLGSSTLGGDGGASSSIGRSRTTFNPVSSAEPYFRPFNVTPSSVSQFVMAEASRGSPSPLLTHQSPVLNTEELYRAAGWMTPLPKDPSSHSRDGGVGDTDEDEAMGDAGKGATTAGRLAVLSSKNEQHDTSQRMAHSLALGSSGGGGGGGGAAAAATAAGVAAKEAEVAVAAAAADAGVRTADRIRDEIAREPVLSLANLAGFGGEPGSGGGGSEAGGGSSSGEEAGGDPGGEDSAEEPGIPKSIAEIYEISNRNRRRNKEKKKLRETAPDATSNSPSRTKQQQPQSGAGQRAGTDTAVAAAAAAGGSAASAAADAEGGASPAGPAANYFSGRKRQKGDLGAGGQQGLGLLADRGRGAGDGRGGADDTMEFMENLGWLSHEQRDAMGQQGTPAAGGGESGANNAPQLEPPSGAAGAGSSTTAEGLGGGEQADGYSRARPRGGGGRGGQGPTGRVGGSGGAGGVGRGKGATPSKRDRDGGRGGGADGGGGGGRGAGPQQPGFRGYDFSQAPPSMGAFHRDGSGGTRGGGGGGFNPFLAAGAPGAGPAATGGGRGGVAGGPTGSAAYGGGRQQQQQQQHWRPRPDTEKAKSMTYGTQSMQGVGQGRGGAGGNGPRRGR
ncbi:unnamed protein product [Ectocarpus fasciculatus]